MIDFLRRNLYKEPITIHVGDKFVLYSDKDNPFEDEKVIIVIVDVRDEWVKYRFDFSKLHYYTMPIERLNSLFTKLDTESK